MTDTTVRSAYGVDAVSTWPWSGDSRDAPTRRSRDLRGAVRRRGGDVGHHGRSYTDPSTGGAAVATEPKATAAL